jgi:hypothetical protein
VCDCVWCPAGPRDADKVPLYNGALAGQGRAGQLPSAKGDVLEEVEKQSGGAEAYKQGAAEARVASCGRRCRFRHGSATARFTGAVTFGLNFLICCYLRYDSLCNSTD